MEKAKSVDDLVTSQSIEVCDFPDFEMLDAKIVSALKMIISNQYFRKRVNRRRALKNTTDFLKDIAWIRTQGPWIREHQKHQLKGGGFRKKRKETKWKRKKRKKKKKVKERRNLGGTMRKGQFANSLVSERKEEDLEKKKAERRNKSPRTKQFLGRSGRWLFLLLILIGCGGRHFRKPGWQKPSGRAEGKYQREEAVKRS